MGGKVTLLEMFFMLLAVIPISKMLSQIFMSLLARIGTVDEEKWAAIGMGAWGGLTGMIVMGRAAIGAIKGAPGGALPQGRATAFPPGGAGPGSAGPQGGVSAAGVGSLGPQGGTGMPGGGFSPVATTFPASRAGGFPSGSAGGFGAGTPPGAASAPGLPGGPFSPVPSGYAVTPTGLAVPAGSVSEGGPAEQFHVLEDAIERGGARGDYAAGVGSVAGYISSFGAPALSPALAAMIGAASKMTAGSIATTYNIGKDLVKQARAKGWEGVISYTGARGKAEASMKILGSVALSPLGARASRGGANTFGNLGRRIDNAWKGYHSVDNAVNWRRPV